MPRPELLEGGCLCGEIRFRGSAPPLRGVICHCSMCRRHSGAPVLAFVHFPAASFTWIKGKPSWYRSSRYAERGFCSKCGSTIAMREEILADRIQVCVGSLDSPESVSINDHVWVGEGISWFKIEDTLPRFLENSSAVASKSLEPLGTAGTHGI
jgi:hypothetical protein